MKWFDSEVRLVGRPDKAVKAVHWSRMKLFANGGFDVTEKLTRTAVNDCQKFDVSSFVAWRVDDEGDIQLKVRWEGFQPQDDTWEELEQLFNDVPVLVRNYLKQHEGEDERLDNAAAQLDRQSAWGSVSVGYRLSIPSVCLSMSMYVCVV